TCRTSLSGTDHISCNRDKTRAPDDIPLLILKKEYVSAFACRKTCEKIAMYPKSTEAANSPCPVKTKLPPYSKITATMTTPSNSETGELICCLRTIRRIIFE